MDGFELCRRVKANERFRTIPLFFIRPPISAGKMKGCDGAWRLALSCKADGNGGIFRAISEVMEKHRTGYIPVRDLPAEITVLDRMQIETYARKLDKKVRELEKERKALRKSKLLLEQKMIDLEKEIAERKKMEKEVQKRIKELEDFYDMAVGREIKMIELKNEIKELKQELEKIRKGNSVK